MWFHDPIFNLMTLLTALVVSYNVVQEQFQVLTQGEGEDLIGHVDYTDTLEVFALNLVNFLELF